jgi:tRNA threonylcarbamoyladenosine biosynthesis protein TsaE
MSMMDKINECTVYSEEQLIDLGRCFGEHLEGHECIALCGSLGAGKTTFTKGIAIALHIPEEIISPSFVLLREYHAGKHPLYHYDLYRLERLDDLEELGFYESMSYEGIKIVEWADHFSNNLEAYDMIIRFLIPNFDQRKLEFFKHG